MPNMPRPMRQLPRDSAGRPIPWFSEVVDGKHDFRITSAVKIVAAVRDSLCWVCGQRRPRHDAAFVIGPMCAVNRVSSEPPSHHACAVYSARECPFLANPKKIRREGNKPEETSMAGIGIMRNPGVALVWSARGWKPFRVPEHLTVEGAGGGVLFDIGTPAAVEWFAHGREATREEVTASIDSGCPTLREVAEKDGPEAVAHFEAELEKARKLIPA